MKIKEIIKNIKNKNWKYFQKWKEGQWSWMSFNLDIVKSDLIPQLKSFLLFFHHKILWDSWAFHLTKNKCQMKNFFKIQQQTEAAFTCHFQCPYCKQEIEDYYDDIHNVKCNFIKYFHYKLKYIQIKPDPTTPGSRHSLVFFPQGLGR